MPRTVIAVSRWECDACGRTLFKQPDEKPKGWKLRRDGQVTCWRRECLRLKPIYG